MEREKAERVREKLKSLDDLQISVCKPLISEKTQHAQTRLMTIIASFSSFPMTVMWQIVSVGVTQTTKTHAVSLALSHPPTYTHTHSGKMPYSPLTNTVPAVNSHLQSG